MPDTKQLEDKARQRRVSERSEVSNA